VFVLFNTFLAGLSQESILSWHFPASHLFKRSVSYFLLPPSPNILRGSKRRRFSFFFSSYSWPAPYLLLSFCFCPPEAQTTIHRLGRCFLFPLRYLARRSAAQASVLFPHPFSVHLSGSFHFNCSLSFSPLAASESLTLFFPSLFVFSGRAPHLFHSDVFRLPSYLPSLFSPQGSDCLWRRAFPRSRLRIRPPWVIGVFLVDLLFAFKHSPSSFLWRGSSDLFT